MNPSFLIAVSLFLTVLPSFLTAVPVPHTSYDYTEQPAPYFLRDFVYPDQPAGPTVSTYGVEREISAWRDLLLFFGLLNQHPEMSKRVFNESSTEQFLILAPTNRALLDFFTQFRGIFQVRLPLLDTISFIAGLSPHLKYMFMELVETHIISGDWSEIQIVQAGKLETLSGASLDVFMFPKITVQSTGRSSHRIFRQIMSIGGPVRRLCFIDTVLLPPSIQDLVPPAYENVSFPRNMSSPEPDMNTTSYENLDSDLAWNKTNPYERHGNDSNVPAIEFVALPSCHSTNCSSNWLQSPYINEITSTLFMGRDTFHSIHSLLMSRTDCNMFAALVRYLPGVMDEIQKHNAPLHMLVPTDRALMEFYAHMVYYRSADMNIPGMEEIMEFVKGHTDMISSMMSGVPAVPNIGDAVLFHFCVDAGKPLRMLRGQVLKTVTGGSVRVSSDGMSVYGADDTKGPVMAISSHATLNGFVTPISGLLTKFDATLATLMGMLAMRASKPGKRYGYNTFHVPYDSYDGIVTPAPFLDDEPEETVQPSERSESGGACFPSDATLIGTSGESIEMKDINAGDLVLVSPLGHSSKIFAFTHRERLGVHPYVEISFSNGMSLTLSDNHYTYADGSLVAARNVRKGQNMTSATGDLLTVDGGRRVWKSGRFAPHSMHGDLIVNGVLVSAYTTNVHPSLAHALLAPVRLFSFVTGVQEPLGSIFYHGAENLSSWVPSGRSAYS